MPFLSERHVAATYRVYQPLQVTRASLSGVVGWKMSESECVQYYARALIGFMSRKAEGIYLPAQQDTLQQEVF